METIMAVINWIKGHTAEIAQIWAALIAICSIIVKLLPVLPADSKLLPLVKLLGKLALNKTVTDADRPVV